MARKLKTFTTSAGFFDLAVAAPSMKAALEAWGAESNLFYQGFAKQSEDEEVIAATMAKPGVVLRRAVGTQDAFSEHAKLPAHLGSGAPSRRAPRHRARSARPAETAKPIDDEKARKAAAAFEREQKRQEARSRREEAAREKERQRRDRAIEAAEAALEEAKRVHQSKLADIDKARRALDTREEAETARWRKQIEQLEGALRRVRAAAF